MRLHKRKLQLTAMAKVTPMPATGQSPDPFGRLRARLASVDTTGELLSLLDAATREAASDQARRRSLALGTGGAGDTGGASVLRPADSTDSE